MKSGTVLRCPTCVPPAVRHADGRRIAGWTPEQIFVGYLRLSRRFDLARPPANCPNCHSPLVERRG